jgi:hypothetical protein
VGGPSRFEGRLEVQIGQHWGSVGFYPPTKGGPWLPYDPTMKLNTAKVACRQLGMQGGAFRGGNFYGRGNSVVMIDVGCVHGREAGLSRCSLSKLYNPSDDFWGLDYEHVGVACKGKRCCLAVAVAVAGAEYTVPLLA